MFYQYYSIYNVKQYTTYKLMEKNDTQIAKMNTYELLTFNTI
jgi:hypothetical protein